jgi:hypothetical protein
VPIEHASSGEKTPNPMGIKARHDIHQHETRHSRPHRRITKRSNSGEPTKRGANDHAPRRLRADHGRNIIRTGHKSPRRAPAFTMPTLIERHTPKPRTNKDFGNRRPHLTPLTTRVKQKDGRPSPNLLTAKDSVRPGDPPRDNHVGPPYLVSSTLP